MTPHEKRIGELEDKLKPKDEKLAELRKELKEATDLADEMKEHVEACNEQLERWIDAFNMQLNDDGEWV